jgi:hypothetical protein
VAHTTQHNTTQHNTTQHNTTQNNVYWRARYDYRRNSIAGLAQHHFAHKELQGLSTTQQLAKLLGEKSIDWNDCPAWYKFGTLVKRESYLLRTTTPKGDEVEATRTRYSFTFMPAAIQLKWPSVDGSSLFFLLVGMQGGVDALHAGHLLGRERAHAAVQDPQGRRREGQRGRDLLLLFQLNYAIFSFCQIHHLKLPSII